MKISFYILVAFIFSSCGKQTKEPVATPSLFTLISPEKSGITFRNDIDDQGKYTPYNTYYIYNGGGVAVGDIDNDGLEDLLFSSNQNGCKLYRNLGNLQFEDITEKAGITYSESWTTGVCMVDINSDGWLDIHICRSGLATDTNRANLLFINNGDGSFVEKAEEFGLNDQGTSTQIYFFDLDLDNDLDAYVLNHPLDFENAYDPFFQIRSFKDSIYSNRFYLNENGKFTESNKVLGVGLEKGFSLSASIGDINNDGWPDVYVANDFISPDHYYINQQGKGFVDQITKVLNKTTLFSMGSDLADANNDGHLDLFVADMEPADHFRRKNNDIRLDKSYYDLIKNRFSYSQFSRNMFFAGGHFGFREIGQLSEISMTDWSWATLFEDLDNDGDKDLFISNGTKRDFHDMDYVGLVFGGDMIASQKRHDANDLITKMPVSLLSNYGFENLGEFQFKNSTKNWGLDKKLNGQGAIIADLNNDGNLEIVINNTDATASIYGNNSNSDSHYLRVKLHYISPNINGIGARVEVWNNGKLQMKEQFPNRGFQSSMSNILHFGLGQNPQIDSITVTWPNGNTQNSINPKVDHQLTISYSSNTYKRSKNPTSGLLIQNEIAGANHIENEFDEVQRDRIVPFGLSRSGPALATGDLNGDGFADLVIGSSVGHELQILFGQPNGDFSDSGNHLTETIEKENTALLLVDIDNDNDLDLYVGNGSNEAWGQTEALPDLVYINDGTGQFSMDPERSPKIQLDSRCLVILDINKDGFSDIFVGGGFVPGIYGETVGSRILLNINGNLEDVTSEIAPSLLKLGAIHSAQLADLDQNGEDELVTAGPWESIRRFLLSDNKLKESEPILSENGLWNTLRIADINADGYPDIVAGNHGLNTLFKASPSQPLELFMTDLDGNGTPDPIVTHHLNNANGTFIDKSEFCEKMPEFNNKFLTNRQFAEADLDLIISGKNMDKLIHRQVYTMKTMVLFNDGNGKFNKVKLPIETQFSPTKAISILDINGDNRPEIILFGNSNTEFYDQGNIMANTGCVLQLNPSGELVLMPSNISGIYVDGVVNSSVNIKNGAEEYIILGRNNSTLIKLTTAQDQ